MTRFNITLTEGVNLVLFALANGIGKEIFVPKIPSYNILDLAKAICPECEIEEIGIRPGEKIHEEMITRSDSLNTIDIGKYYIILPPMDKHEFEKYQKYYEGNKLEEGFYYSSGNNSEWLSINELRDLIANYEKSNKSF
jgi:FlaA1/EpsC-like NDP-sugar epimerase